MKTNTARIVFDVNDSQSVEIPFEFNNNNVGGFAKNRGARGSKAKFYYLDINEYERHIRADERVRIKKQRKKCIKDTICFTKAIVKYTWQKAVGLCIVVNAVSAMYSNYLANTNISFSNWLVALLTIPVGLYLIFSKYYLFKRNNCTT